MMKAVIWTKYGGPDVLELGEVEKPNPKANEVRIKIHAATVTAGDVELRSLKLPIWLKLPLRIFVGIFKPTRITILGQEWAGEIDSIGEDVKLFNVGDKVFGTTGIKMGGYAEYLCLPDQQKEMGGPLASMSANMSYAEAAATPTAGMEALHFMRLGEVKSGDRVLINGAGGSIGTFAVQLAKHFGAEVTAVDSTGKLDMLRSIGADHVVDYTKQDFTKRGKSYDVIFDVPGKSSFSRSIKCLKDGGRYLFANPRMMQMLRGRLRSAKDSKKVIIGAASQKVEDLIYLRELIEAGTLKAVIDRSYNLQQIVEAHTYVESGQKKGNVVITII